MATYIIVNYCYFESIVWSAYILLFSDLSLTGNNDDNHEKRVAEWKFSQLDKNKDNKLRRKEVRALKRMVKKVIKPRSCAKTFISYCDFDQNKRIEPREWTSCLGVYTNGEFDAKPA